ncbi:DUF1062 domain-containing protein [Lentzea flava]|uniref:DUF1062 domain-containing protein n=1 Tax=Lentzea flava TaxID=103732 RepID=A0ABQ2UK66_9PSEU|nr:DUF1062 domain-containing protein [Lentzea flava]MCP2199773.1 hypothetical protein [Lentzea flava]GGU38420.1 hypothetical protein GCM10010178_33360 [Lentzea flava]
MSSVRHAENKSLWVVRELALPAVVKPCVDCGHTRHLATGKIRVNANGKHLDVWLLIGCERCDRTSKIPVHERVHVQALDHRRLVRFEHNDPAIVRELVHAQRRLDWTGTWVLETDLPFYEIGSIGSAGEPLEVFVRFELPAPVRVEKLLTSGLGLSRPAVKRLVDSGRIRLPMAVDARVRADFAFVIGG